MDAEAYYTQNLDLFRRTCRYASPQHHDPDEAESIGLVALVQGLKENLPTDELLKTIRREVRKELSRESRRRKILERDSHTLGGRTPSQFSLTEFLSEIGEEAQVVVHIVLEMGPVPGRWAGLKALKDRLSGLGWGMGRIQGILREIREALYK